MLEFNFRNGKIKLFGTNTTAEYNQGKKYPGIIFKYLNIKAKCLYLKIIACYQCSENL